MRQFLIFAFLSAMTMTYGLVCDPQTLWIVVVTSFTSGFEACAAWIAFCRWRFVPHHTRHKV
jgi:hypothetical protein